MCIVVTAFISVYIMLVFILGIQPTATTTRPYPPPGTSQPQGSVAVDSLLPLNFTTDRPRAAPIQSNGVQNVLNYNVGVSIPVNTVGPASRVSHRIPYTQNVVDDDETQTLSEPTVVRPKKQNIPSNGGVDHLISKVPTTQEEDKRLSRLGGQLKKLSKFALPYFNWNGLKGVGGGGSGVGTDAKKSMLAPSSVEAGNTDNASRLVSSEVLLVNGTTVIRPTSLPLNSHISPHRMSNGVGRQPTTGKSNKTAPVDQNLPRSGTTFESIHQKGSALEEHVESLEMIKSRNVGAAGTGEGVRGGGESEPPVMMMTVMGAGGGEGAAPIMDTTDITVGSSGSGSPHAESSTDISSSSELEGVVPYRENLAPPSVDVIGTQSCDNYGFEVSRSPRAGQAACVV